MLVDLGTYYICTISLQGGWSNPPADNVQANLVWHRWRRHYRLAWYRLVEAHGLGITSICWHGTLVQVGGSTWVGHHL